MYKIIETDNTNSEHLNEKFLNIPPMDEESADYICHAINDVLCEDRYWKSVPDDYELQP